MCPAEGSPPPEVVSLYTKLSNLVFVGLFVLLQIFMMVRLDGFSNWYLEVEFGVGT